MTYAQALAALERRQESRIELGLDRVRRHLARLGDPQRLWPSFHVAGTNGKGSVCAMLDSCLRSAGYRTGFYLSPHLQDVRERIRVDGRWIPPAAFSRLLAAALEAEAGEPLTYFELLTSVAFQWFAERRVDVAVLETGLGGRLDATNVIESPLACVITSISLDHVQLLGATPAEIAAEKAGILKPGCPAVCGALAPAALRVVRSAARAAGAPLRVVRRGFAPLRVDWAGNRQVVSGPGGRRLALSLLGRRQGLNAAVAAAALSAAGGRLPVPERALRRGLATVRWPGRFEVRRAGGRRIVLDGAHNVEAMRHLARTWAGSPWAGRAARWIMGVLRDKDAAGLVAAARPHLSDVAAVRPSSPRALAPAELAALVRRAAPRARVTIERDAGSALRAWRRSGPPVAVVCGSFYLVASARKALGGSRVG